MGTFRAKTHPKLFDAEKKIPKMAQKMTTREITNNGRYGTVCGKCVNKLFLHYMCNETFFLQNHAFSSLNSKET